MASGRVEVVGTSAVGNASVVGLRWVDYVRARLAAEDLERKMLNVTLSAGGVARRYGGKGGFRDG